MAAPSLDQLNSIRHEFFPIPPFDTKTFTYVGSTNNVATIVFSRGGTAVATLTFTYVASGAADDDDVATIVMSV